jgi:hypothetical protein
MRLKLCACLALVGALASVTNVVATPITTSFLKVDIDGSNIGGAQAPGITEPGYLPWTLQQGLFLNWSSSTDAVGVTTVFPTTEGNITATLTGRTTGSRDARNRGAGGGALPNLYQDFVYVTRPLNGFGQHWLDLELSGLMPNQAYEFTGFAREPFNGGTGEANPEASFQCWTDLAQLGGLDGPGAWMDANVGPGAVYQPAVGGVNNPIPKKGRAAISGPNAVGPYDYSLSFVTTADATGKATIYGYADPNGYTNTQTVSLMNGFELGKVPEPTSLGLLAIGFFGLAGFRRRVR